MQKFIKIEKNEEKQKKKKKKDIDLIGNDIDEELKKQDLEIKQKVFMNELKNKAKKDFETAKSKKEIKKKKQQFLVKNMINAVK